MRKGKQGETTSRRINRRIRRMGNRTIRQANRRQILDAMLYGENL